MTKQINNTYDKISEIAEDLIFVPSPAQRNVKTVFWVRYNEMGLDSDITQAMAKQITNNSSLDKWWRMPGFENWFKNKDEHRERLEYLYSLALDAAEEILLNPDAQASAKVNMIKAIGELANKFPNKYEKAKFADEDINKMSEAELKLYLNKKGIKYITG